MVDFARLVMTVDASGMVPGEQALDQLARTGSRVEGSIKLNTKGIEQSMAALGNAIGSLGGTMKSLEAAVARSMGSAAQEAQKGARSFDDLRRSIDPAYAASQRFAQVQRELAGMVASGEASQRAANIVLEQAAARYMGVATAAERAEQAQREQAQAVANATGNYEQLRAALDPVYASSKRYEQAQETLTAAVKQGVVSQKEMNRVLAMAERQFLAPANGLRGMAGAANDAGKGLARFTPQITNASFQIQDFAVQVASGQSAFTAFAQQFPQLAGSFGFSGKIALLGAGLGTLVAVGAAVAPMLFNMASAAGKAEKAVDGLSEAVARYKQYSDASAQSQSDLIAQFGTMAGEAQRMNEVLAQFARIDAVAAMDTAIKGLTETFGGLSREVLIFQSVGGVTPEILVTLANLKDELNLTQEQARAVVSSLERMATAGSMEQQIAASVAFNEQMVSAFGSIEKMPKELQAVAKQALLLASSASEIVDPLERARQEQQRMADAANDIIGKYDRQAVMSRTIAQYGADSAQVEALKRSEAMRAAQALLEQHNISGPLADQLVRSAMATFDAATGADAAAISLRNAEAAARGLAAAIAAAAGFTVNLEQQGWVLDAQIKAQAEGLNAATAGMIAQQKLQATGLRDAAIEAANGEMLLIRAANEEYEAQMRLIDANASKQTQIQETTKAQQEAASSGRKATSEAEKAAKKAATAAKKTAEALDKEAQQWRELLDPVAKYKREVSDLTKLSSLLSKSEMAEAQRRLNVELADSLPLAGEFVDTMTEGLLSGFNGTLSSMGDMLKKWLAQAIAMAAKNRIVIGMGLGGMGGVGGVASALGSVPGFGGVGGMLGAAGGVMGGLGTFMGTGGLSSALAAARAPVGGVLGGMSSVIGGFTSGGLSGGLGAIGSSLGGITSGLGGLGAALGAVALPLAAVAGVFSFFSTKTKQLDAGLRVTIDGMDALTETFNKVEKKKFWGMSKKVRTYYDHADAETQRAVENTVNGLQAGIMSAADALGFGARTFEDFAYSLRISTKGLSEEDAQKALIEAIGGVSDAYAGMVPGLKRLTNEGETASAALSRLSQSLVGVNGIMDTLGHRFRAAGLACADAASQIADAFGSLDAMASATQRFYQAFYSEQERLETTTRQTGKALADLGLAMPRTRNEYRAIIASLDLTTRKGRETYAALIGLADAFDVILPQVASLTAEMAALQGSVQTGLDAAISAAGEAATANARAAADWYKAAASIREYMDKLRGTASALFSPQQALRYNRGQYQATRMRAMAGDLPAAQDITGTADRYLSSVLATAKTREEAALAQARVLSDLGLLQGSGDIEGARHDVIAGLLGKQVEVMERYRDVLVANGTLTAKQIEGLGKKLGGLDDAIAAAELINYQYLKEKLKVTVDVIADAKIPAHLKTLLANATNGVEGFVDFIARSDLPADMKWLALARSSKHLKTVAYLAQNNLSLDYTRLALRAGSRYQVKVSSIVEKGGALDPDQLRKLLTGTASGRITLGGTFKFDPAAGFATWYESATRTAISTPMNVLRDAMGTLRGSLLSLRAAILAEAKRQREAVEKAKETVNKPDPKPKPKPAPAKKYSAADYRGRTVITNNGFAQSDGDRFGREYGYSLTGPLGGTKVFGSQTEANAWLRANNYPAFAAGGTHRGGPAYVGEKDLELVAPSRIYNPSETRAMLDNRETVAELKALRTEIAELRAHARRTADSAVQTEKTLKRVDALGLKIDPDQNKVTT